MKRSFAMLLLIAVLAACTAPHKKAPPAPPVTMRLTLVPQGELQPGKPVEILVKLENIKERSILTPQDLEQFQLLIIDPSLNDYQPIQPQPTKTPGLWRFNFRPKMSGGYRIWADVTPKATHNREFDMADLGMHRAGVIDRNGHLENTVEGYHVALSFDKPLIIGDEAIASLHITDKNGRDVPIAKGDITGFYDDYRTVLHANVTNSAAHIMPSKAGFLRLFARVDVNRKTIFVPFGANVATAD